MVRMCSVFSMEKNVAVGVQVKFAKLRDWEVMLGTRCR
jgi:hypothetical protein